MSSPFFSIRWDLDKSPPPSRKSRGGVNYNILPIRVTCIDPAGKRRVFVKHYEQWIGVCTSRIDRVCRTFHQYFPGAVFRHNLLMKNCKKILPYLADRLRSNKLTYVEKPFYRVYVTGASSHEVGRFFAQKYKIAYYDKSDWSCRLYLELCTRHQSSGFLYKWYDVNDTSPWLLEAFTMIPDRVDPPQWSIAAFDLETVPMDSGDRVPTGIHPEDRIVMISVVKWRGDERLPKRYLLYVDPAASTEQQQPLFALEDVKILRYTSESSLLNDFHALIDKCQVLTGYNINGFDLPCLFARLLWLGKSSLLLKYRSHQVGDSVVTTLLDKWVVDLYVYFSTFSNYDLPGFKLDDVAKAKLRDSQKLPIKSTGIHAWYTAPVETLQRLKHSTDVRECHRALQPRHVDEHQFGTFRLYLEYCMRDSDLVYQLFQKEKVLSFLMERANFATLNLVEALHFGNSRFILELFKSYGTMLGYFVNIRFFRNTMDAADKYRSMFVDDGRTYQGALNYCHPRKMYEDVSVMDFTSMYPCALLSSNLCYGTCDILTAQELESLDSSVRESLDVIPYRNHSEKDFETAWMVEEKFEYPRFDPHIDEFAIVVNRSAPGFLPNVVSHFLTQRKRHQKLFKETRHVIHDNAQLNIKILINSLYGVMANKDSVLSYLQIGIAIVTLARYQLLGSYHYLKSLGYEVCYADTDSLMVPRWPHDHCNQVNEYLGLPNVELKYEQRMKKLLVLSKKRYVYVKTDGRVVSKGFQKKVNELVKFMSDKILRSALERYDDSTAADPSVGWITWVETLVEAFYMCRDPKKFSITRKAKMLKDYKSKTCATYRMLLKHPEKENTFVDYVFSRADVAANCRSSWIMDVDQVKYIDFEQLFMSQKKIFADLLNVAYWGLPNPLVYCDMVLNTMRWKCFAHAELLHCLATGTKKVTMLVERGVKYTFKINDHTPTRRTGKLVRDEGDTPKRKNNDEDTSKEKKRRKKEEKV